MYEPSDESTAFLAFARGDLADGDDALVRRGAAQVIAENRRLRAIHAAMQREGLGEGVLVECAPIRGGGMTVVLCSGSRDEGVLMRAVIEAVRGMLGPGGRIDKPVITGTEADAAAPVGGPGKPGAPA